MSIEILLMAVILVLEVLHYKERRDLYSRLMAKSLPEYTGHVDVEKRAKIEKVKPPEYIQI